MDDALPLIPVNAQTLVDVTAALADDALNGRNNESAGGIQARNLARLSEAGRPIMT